MRNCASGMQALDSAIANIQCGRSQLVLAGGVDALSRAPLLYSDKMVMWFSLMAQARTPMAPEARHVRQTAARRCC
jgi:acetyl-CoA C-acetyltransferase